MQSVLRLDEIDRSMAARVGGKAVNLAILLRAGLPVPGGFCITTAAYRSVVGSLVTELSIQLNDVDSLQLGARAARARDLVESAPVPAELERELLDAYRTIGSPAVAVRSSATAEDLDFASFAGQQDTYLNVVGESALLAAVRRCWASLWTDRAVSYRTSQGIAHETVALAVVVQEMVQSAVAGVMFTANPVTGSRRQTVIDASPGLGEAVVSGAVNPDHVVVETATGAVLQRRSGDKRVLVRARSGGGTETLEHEDQSDEAACTDQQLVDLAALGARVQDLYGAPQDIEWAIDEAGALWLTQSRPITTLYPLPSRPAADQATSTATGIAAPSGAAAGEQRSHGARVYLCLTLAQGLTRPITPMGLAAFRLMGSSVATVAGSPPARPSSGPPAYAEAGQRVFVDFTGVIGNPVGRRGALAVFGVMEARAAAVIRRLVDDPDVTRVSSSPLAALRPVARVLRHVGLPRRVLLAAWSPAAAYREIGELERRLRADLVLGDGASPEQRLEHVRRLLGLAFLFMPTVSGYPLAGFVLLALARQLLRGLVAPGELQTVLRGLPHNVTTEMDLALWQLSADVGAEPAARQVLVDSAAAEVAAAYAAGRLPPSAQEGLAAFLKRYGHRAVAEIDLGMPRWSDDPTHLVGMITNYLRNHEPALAADVQFRAGEASATAMMTSLVARARTRGRVRGAVVAFGLERARQLAGLRESPKNLLVLALAGVRRHLQLLGEVLAADHRIDSADDVFFLDLEDVERGLAGAHLQGQVAQRREDYSTELRRRHVPRVLLSDGTEPEAVGTAVDSPEGALLGSPASAGVVTAPARVVLDPVGARLEPGEILVAPSTDPGWTPLFLTAGGLVMEMGGSNSHGAVVAREYGIPAVVGVPDATTTITTGQTVTVDGAAGSVLPAAGSPLPVD